MFDLFGALVSGFFLFNAIPHFVQGICGKPHMTPFSRQSPAVVNVIWGWVNIILGLIIASVSWPKDGCNLLWWVIFIMGGMIISLYLAVFWSNPDARLPWHKD